MISRADFENTLGFAPPPWERWLRPSSDTPSKPEADNASTETAPEADGLELLDEALSARWAVAFGLAPAPPTIDLPDTPSVVLRRRLLLPLEGASAPRR